MKFWFVFNITCLAATIAIVVASIFSANIMSRKDKECADKGGKRLSGRYESVCIRADSIIK